jgi:hypothetical protein
LFKPAWKFPKNKAKNEPKLRGSLGVLEAEFATGDTTWSRLRAGHDMLASQRLVPLSAPSDSAF